MSRTRRRVSRPREEMAWRRRQPSSASTRINNKGFRDGTLSVDRPEIDCPHCDPIFIKKLGRIKKEKRIRRAERILYNKNEQ